MRINRQLGIVHDAIFYSVIFLNQENAFSFLKIYAEKESDIFENYYEFRSKYAIEPSEDLYPFFFVDSKTSCVLRKYFDERFDFFVGTSRTFVQLLKDKDRLKSFVYYYYLKPLENDVNIQHVLRGDGEETAMAVALLTSIHSDYPKQICKLFYNFDELVDELILYMENILHKMTLFHGKRKSLIENTINDFLKSENLRYFAKGLYSDEKFDFSKQTFAISLFNRTIIYGSPKLNNKVVFLLGDKFKNVPVSLKNYNHITVDSVAFIFYNETAREIINIIMKGEKTITQLSLILHYSRPTIDKFVGLLYDELAIKISRKIGNEVYYKINNSYFIAAKMVMNKAFGKLLLECK